jgi:type IV pilus assembly protein PilV
MLKPMREKRAACGFSLIEVMVAIVITAFGLLGVAGLMGKMQQAETEGFDRSQAMALLWDMSDRVYAAMPTTTTVANAYTNGGTTVTVGTGATGYTSPCTGTGAALDLCEWNFALQGAAETRSGTKVGAMTGARGCVTLVTAPNPATGTCTPATFRISVTWQGLLDTLDQTTNANTCGSGQYGLETRRRIVSEMITIGLPGCT